MTTIPEFPTVKLTLPPKLPRIKSGMALLTDSDFTGNEELELVKFLKDGEEFASGEVMRTRAVDLGHCAGERHALCLLAQEDTVPHEWREVCLVFPGTRRRERQGGVFILTMFWDTNHGPVWALHWHCLDDDFADFGRLVRYR
ncbi:MAG: hypothetical protein A3G11_01945 [Candidatus Lloydbacteria bacterium RIFCSPLOWO2_12_FULL_51_9]|uniref:Uncharacterized protein n=1 Tax=Candidatus Lloydbacteria bacterium RIFCSPLOWO2_12_FULL_51_9 TaxID=1798669 RepID=A0A1G2DTW6_9BACT|nr:MAG: hypothetical protein A3G11_01945 [Candidatus Lloydbacteria bacterium RIFCSPLOWO2_12_FULL_51_9]